MKQSVRKGAIFFVLFFLFTTIYGQSSPCSKIILHNGKVFTSDKANLYEQAIAISGRFVTKVGTNQEVLALQDPSTQVIDLQGKTVVPGLNNAHVHAFWGSSYPRSVTVNVPDFVPGPGPTVNELLALVSGAVANNPAGTWIFATVGVNVSEDPAISRFIIDAVAPNHPVVFFVWWGHGTYFNTKAMQLMGIGEQHPDPVGGFYERVAGTNIVKGVAHEYAEFLINRFFADQMTNQEFTTLYKAFETAALKYGYTSIQDYSVGLTHSRTLDLLDLADLSIRWRAICFPLSLNEPMDNRLKYSPLRPLTLLKGSGIKWITEGTPIERLGATTVEYQDKPGWFGSSSFTPQQFTTMLTRALAGIPQKTQTHLHITCDANWDVLFSAMAGLAPDCVWNTRRTRVEHGDLMRPDHYQQAINKGIVLVQNPTHFGIPEIFAQRFSPSVRATVMPFKTLIDQGIPVALGTDNIGSVGNPFLDIFLATINPIQPSQAITVEEAVIAYTAGSAFAEFQEHLKGTLAPGKFADLAVLSQDIFTIAPPAIIGTESVLTMVDGKIVYQNLNRR